MIGLKRGLVELVPYNPQWATLFVEEKESLKNILGSLARGIEHIGSTAIPGLAAKPVVDILVGIEMNDVKEIKEKLENNNWIWRPKFGDVKTHIVFAKGSDEERSHYLHLTQFEGNVWNERIAFRNYLITHEKEKMEYQDLKYKAMNEFGDDRKLYTSQKDSFVKEILDKALGEY